MNDDLSAFEALISVEGAVWRASAADQARQLLVELHAAQDGHVNEFQIREVATLAGRNERTVYRWLREIRATDSGPDDSDVESCEPPGVSEAELADMTVLEQLKVAGPSAFRFDDQMLALAYLAGGNQRFLHAELVKAGYPMPSLPTVCRRWRELRPLIRAAAKEGLRDRAKHLLYVRHSAKTPNQAWQFDTFNYDIYVRPPRGTKPVRPTGLILIDDHSRFIVGYACIPHATRSEDVLALFGSAMDIRPDSNKRAAGVAPVMIGGAPDLLLFDNEAAIVSNAVTDAINMLPGHNKPSPAHTPTTKGKIERNGDTIQQRLVKGLPGRVSKAADISGRHMLDVDQSTLISWDEFVARFEQVIWEHNYQRRHSGIGNKIPFDAYRRNLQPVRLTDEEVASMMLVTGRSDGLRKVHPDGIHFRNRYYAGAAIGHLIDTEVQVRAWHQRTDRIAVYVDDTFVALIGESNGLDADQRRLIMEHRIADERAVRRGFRTARAASVETGRQIETGETVDLVAAITKVTADSTAGAAAPVTAAQPYKGRGVRSKMKKASATATPPTAKQSSTAEDARRAARNALRNTKPTKGTP